VTHPHDPEVSEELLDRIAAGLEHPPRPDFLSEDEWKGIIDSRDPSTIRMAGTMHVDLYRDGVEGTDQAQGAPVLVLTTTGRRSGRAITTCVNFMPRDDELLVVGSFAAFEKSPHWVLNLEADPHCTVERDGHSYPAVARAVTGDERAERWPEMTDYFPLWGHFQRYCRREFPVFALPLAEGGQP
jgi:deazaflavin-dependent oxidoreductase (nitroreductase family)